MKKLITIASFLIVMTGCIDYSSTVKLSNDGSGTIEETVLVSDALVQMINSFAQSFGDTSSAESSFDIFDEAELKTQAAEMGEGVKYLRGEKIVVEGKEGYKAVFSFDDISKLKLSDKPDEKIPADDMSMMNETGEESSYITFEFTRGNPAELIINFPEEEMEEEAEKADDVEGGSEEENDMMTEQMKMLMKDFRVSMKLQLTGDVVETNATHFDGNEITFFEMDFAKLLDMPEKFEKFKDMQPNSMAEAKDLIKDIPGFKVELNEKVFVKFD